MRRRGFLIGQTLCAAALAVLAVTPAHGAGFAIGEQGAKALGMANAFVAQADDPSALYYNAGGLAFVTKPDGSVGVTYIRTTKANFQGANPFPGDGASGTQKTLSVFPPHAYYVQPINSTIKVGLGIESPFGLTTEWKNPNQFAGRFLSTKAAIRAFDINPTIAFQATPDLGIGVGFIARISDVELKRNIPAVDPFRLGVVDVASSRLKGDFSEGYGFDAGLLAHLTPNLSLGLSYRSQITVDYTGNATLTQILTGDPQFDAAVAAQLPFGRKLPVATSIKYPDTASVGLAYGFMPGWLVEVDGGYSGWSHFKEVNITFSQHDLPDTTVVERWKNAYNYRIGLRWDASPGVQMRLGYVRDQTPQPEQTVNPLLPDNDRNGFTIGVGLKSGFGNTDLALMYLDLGKRTRAKTFADDPSGDFFGSYQTRAILLAATFTF